MGGRAVNISTYEFWQDKSIEIITLSLHSGKKKEKVFKKTPEQPLYRHSDPMWGQLFYRLPGMIMSGQFISLPWFLSRCNKNSEWWTKRYRTTDQLQLSSTQADRSLLDTSTGVLLIFLINHAWLQPFRLLSSSQCKVELVSTTSNEREWKWAYTQGQVTI